jgi:hypothetical protein
MAPPSLLVPRTLMVSLLGGLVLCATFAAGVSAQERCGIGLRRSHHWHREGVTGHT